MKIDTRMKVMANTARGQDRYGDGDMGRDGDRDAEQRRVTKSMIEPKNKMAV